MKLLYLFALIVLLQPVYAEDLSWMVGHDAMYMNLDIYGAGIHGAFNVQHGNISAVHGNFAYINGHWINSNWIWSIDLEAP